MASHPQSEFLGLPETWQNLIPIQIHQVEQWKKNTVVEIMYLGDELLPAYGRDSNSFNTPL